jgi:hypothetical protein
MTTVSFCQFLNMSILYFWTCPSTDAVSEHVFLSDYRSNKTLQQPEKILSSAHRKQWACWVRTSPVVSTQLYQFPLVFNIAVRKCICTSMDAYVKIRLQLFALRTFRVGPLCTCGARFSLSPNCHSDFQCTLAMRLQNLLGKQSCTTLYSSGFDGVIVDIKLPILNVYVYRITYLNIHTYIHS